MSRFVFARLSVVALATVLLLAMRGELLASPQEVANDLEDFPTLDDASEVESADLAGGVIRVLGRAARTISAAVKESGDVEGKAREALARFDELEALTKNVDSGEATPYLEDLRDEFRADWKMSVAARDECKNELERVRKEKAEILRLVDTVDQLVATARSGGEVGVESDVLPIADAAESFEAGLAKLDEASKRLSERLDEQRELVDEVSSRFAAHRKKERRALAETEAIDEVANDLASTAKRLAPDLGLSGIATAVNERTKDRANVVLDVSYFDDRALDAAKSEDVAPTAEYLERVPELVSALFAGAEGLARVELRIRANHTGDTGHDELWTIQRFRFDRDRWGELTTGKFKGDWTTLLEKSEPTPPYPREGFSTESVMVVLVALVVIFAVSFLVLARFQVRGRL